MSKKNKNNNNIKPLEIEESVDVLENQTSNLSDLIIDEEPFTETLETKTTEDEDLITEVSPVDIPVAAPANNEINERERIRRRLLGFN